MRKRSPLQSKESKMKKEYEIPNAEFIQFCAKDILAASYDITPGDNELPIVPFGDPSLL